MKQDPYFKFVALVVLSGVVLAVSGIGDTIVPTTVPLAQATTRTPSVVPADVTTITATTPADSVAKPTRKQLRRLRAQKPVS
jgi:hypothetical protein